MDASPDLKTWYNGTVNFTADSTEYSSFYNKPSSRDDRFYRLIRVGIEDFDNSGFADDFGDGPAPSENEDNGGGGPGGGGPRN